MLSIAPLAPGRQQSRSCRSARSRTSTSASTSTARADGSGARPTSRARFRVRRRAHRLRRRASGRSTRPSTSRWRSGRPNLRRACWPSGTGCSDRGRVVRTDLRAHGSPGRGSDGSATDSPACTHLQDGACTALVHTEHNKSTLLHWIKPITYLMVLLDSESGRQTKPHMFVRPCWNSSKPRPSGSFPSMSWAFCQAC
jgi:hypothetical protein